jgi:hypothetical protein
VAASLEAWRQRHKRFLQCQIHIEFLVIVSLAQKQKTNNLPLGSRRILYFFIECDGQMNYLNSRANSSVCCPHIPGATDGQMSSVFFQ